MAVQTINYLLNKIWFSKLLIHRLLFGTWSWALLENWKHEAKMKQKGRIRVTVLNLIVFRGYYLLAAQITIVTMGLCMRKVKKIKRSALTFVCWTHRNRIILVLSEATLEPSAQSLLQKT